MSFVVIKMVNRFKNHSPPVLNLSIYQMKPNDLSPRTVSEGSLFMSGMSPSVSEVSGSRRGPKWTSGHFVNLRARLRE